MKNVAPVLGNELQARGNGHFDDGRRVEHRKIRIDFIAERPMNSHGSALRSRPHECIDGAFAPVGHRRDDEFRIAQNGAHAALDRLGGLRRGQPAFEFVRGDDDAHVRVSVKG